MNHQEATILCRYVKAACPQQAFDEFTADAWADLLGDLRFVDCKEAAKIIVQRQPFCAPAELRAEVKRLRAARITAVEHKFIPPPDCRDYGGWLAGQRRLAADGDWHEPEPFGLTHRDMQMLESTFRAEPREPVTPATIEGMRQNVMGKRPPKRTFEPYAFTDPNHEVSRQAARERAERMARQPVDVELPDQSPSKVIDRAAEAARKVTDTPLPEPEETL